MKYTVRTTEGELTYSSMGELARARRLGLIDLEDEVQEEGREKWRKAASIPELAKIESSEEDAFMGADLFWILLFVIVGSLAIFLLAQGNYVEGGVTALGLGVLIAQISAKITRFRKQRR